MNILILSCGTRNKLIRYFKESGNGIDRVVVTDSSIYAPALYEADKYYIVPCLTVPEYIDIILDICKEENINAVLPLQEDELLLIAFHRQKFIEIGVIPIVSEQDTIEICRNKYAFYCHMLRNNLPVLPSCRNFQEFQDHFEKEKITFPVFIKPVQGCGSIGVQKVDNIELLSVICKYSVEDFLIQQFAEGEEYGVDMYVDMLSHQPVSIFLKKKLRMRAGETDKSISIKEEKLVSLIRKTANSLSLLGPVDIDVFCINGDYYISEINPRFGGGYPHAHVCGMNFPKLIANNIAGRENSDAVGCYENDVCIMKYADVMLLKRG